MTQRNKYVIKHGKRLAALAGAFSMATASMALSPVTAGAATNTATGLCGSGYTTEVERMDITGGSVYLMYNSSNGYNCVVTIKTADVGTPTAMAAYLGTKAGTGGEPSTWQEHDSGNYSYFAGPIYLYAPHTCVYYGGQAESGLWGYGGPTGCN
ncbi:MAG TPA: hypothetical protein VFN97_21650 [Actinospica sp.]|nr:hypothetical protein [Actinospica sp.]